MVRYYFIILPVLFFVGCATGLQKYDPEKTEASKTISQLTELSTAPAGTDKIVIDDSGLTKSITTDNFLSRLASTLGFNMENDNLDSSITTAGASAYFYNNGSVLENDSQFRFRVPFKHNLIKVILTTDDNVGTATVDIWVDEAGGSTGLDDVTVADSLFTTATNPSIDAGADQYVETTTFDTNENLAIPAGSYYIINLDSVSTLTKLNVDLEFTKIE